MPKKGQSGQLFKKLFNIFFDHELNNFEEYFDPELATLICRDHKSVPWPLQTFTVNPSRVQGSIGKEALEIAFTSPSCM
jgi:hypothetical protein